MHRVELVGLLVASLLIGSHSHRFSKGQSSIAYTIVKTFDEISNQNDKLKTIIKSFFGDQSTSTKAPEPAEGECLCTPFYLCNNGEVNRDGSKLFEPRLLQESVNPCKTVGDICCQSLTRSPPLREKDDRISDNYSCGYGSEIPGDYYISDPTTAKFGEYPWTALVLNLKNQYQCVGSLIHPEVVLTTAHCINDSENYIARVGQWNTTGNIEPLAHQNMSVKSIVKHPKFVFDNLIHNAALLFLENPFKLDRNVNTACLADSSTVPYTQLRKSKCAATGWGSDVPKGIYRRAMKKIEFSLISNPLCQNEFRKTRLGKWFQLHQTFLCAFGKNGRDLCYGDGGGPLVCEISRQPLRYLQVGITSWGLGCANNLPSVFTKVTSIKHWIDQEMSARNLDTSYYTPM
ncbi:phenoloxidase-activating factor 2-like [Photinus pyralis]|uniref:phenoloxidase-activating factor 2-like n=1 Tax=Photinus pyralis TaxID=7054 RepID=UPI0012671B78|nr:phenoloxidase-activating factor 2-like [Photinus pyralis]XP_031334111.1 phenoloxidase-activating factor 2-like [Photinus pyralis]